MSASTIPPQGSPCKSETARRRQHTDLPTTQEHLPSTVELAIARSHPCQVTEGNAIKLQHHYLS